MDLRHLGTVGGRLAATRNAFLVRFDHNRPAAPIPTRSSNAHQQHRTLYLDIEEETLYRTTLDDPGSPCGNDASDFVTGFGKERAEVGFGAFAAANYKH